MDCQVCRTQLPSEAWACPNCGTPTPAYYATSGASAYDPTIPAAAGLSPSVMNASPLPPTQYGVYPNASSLPGPSPVTPYEAPPPPLPRRSGKRIGILVGVVLLVLLVIGGGVFAWLRSTAAATFTAHGAFTILDSTNTSVTQDGQNTISGFVEHGVFTGDLTGSYTFDGTFTLHPDHTGTFSGNLTCTCTVSGKSGTLVQSISATEAADGSFQGQVFDFQGTGDLANLHGQGVFSGKGNNGTYSDQLHFDG